MQGAKEDLVRLSRAFSQVINHGTLGLVCVIYITDTILLMHLMTQYSWPGSMQP